jgi:hypothetical protein
MNEYVWVLPSDRVSSISKSGISTQYILPQSDASNFEKDLVSSTVWLIVRGRADRVVAVLHIKRVEQFSDGYLKDNYLITINPTCSFSFTSMNSTDKTSASDFSNNFKLGLNLLDSGASQRLHIILDSYIQKRIAEPTLKSLKNLRITNSSKSNDRLVRDTIFLLAASFNLQEVWISSQRPNLGPFANFAFCLIKQSLGKERAEECLNLLNQYDPVLNVKAKATNRDSEKQRDEKSINVDLDFTEIEPDNIFARTFVKQNGGELDISAALERTEQSEKIHQEMLRDISTYLLGQGRKPFESGSIDLMFEEGDQVYIFELKSASTYNLIAQTSKGAFQLAYYMTFVRQEFPNSTCALITHKIEDEHLEQVCGEAMAFLGLKRLIYDPSIEWPNRVLNLLHSNSKEIA